IKSPVVLINNLPQKGCGPLTHNFTANINSIEPVTNYVWDFGDGTTSTLSSPSHTYTSPGAYTVSLFYSTSSGCSDRVKVTNGILVGSKPKAGFSAAPRDVCASTNIKFTDLSAPNPDEWLWLFGDGSTSEAKNPEHQYADSGFFSITLIASNRGCADTLVIPKYIHIKPPIARFTDATTCDLQGHVTFINNSIGATAQKWDFGDGTSSSVKNPSHDYTLSGVYTVQLTVSNNTTGCVYTKIDTVSVLKEIADFSSSVTDVCKNTPVIFTAFNSIPANINSYTWKFGDGSTVTATSNSISHSYKKAGVYNVTMIITTKNGCRDTIVKPLAITVNGPTAVFKTENPGACQNSVVNFIDSSYANNGYDILQWQWNWGDGFSQSFDKAQLFQHAYATAGNYSVSLKVTDNNGCTDSVSYLNSVVISKPVALFKGDTLSCTSHAIKFQNLSTGPELKYLWNFGDGITSTQQNPSHIYKNEGTYTVSLSITDLYNCSDFISKANYVKIADAKANFTVSDSTGTCPPLIVNFSNTATDYSGWTWDFGDGTSSTSLNPSHFYASPGTFKAVLNVKGPGGCSDQKSIEIKVKGPVGSFTYNNISGCKPLQTNFKATTSKNTSFIWDFNDGTTVVTPDSVVAHIYKTADKYLPRMILVDAAGCKVPVNGSDSINVYGVTAAFTNVNNTYCDSAKVVFTNTSTANDIITKYLWVFGDKATSVLRNPIHNYNATGNYTAQLIVTSKNGCKDSVSLSSPIRIVKSPKIVIGGNPGACTPAVLTFAGIISVPDTSAITWNWDFANGNVSTLQNPPSQTFEKAGSYPVRAVAINSSGCRDTVIKVVDAYPLPDLKLTPDTALCKGGSVVLKANDAQTYSWSPASYLSCSNCAVPVSRPDSAIKYFVTGGSAKGCFSTDSVFVDVKLPNTVAVGGPDTLCFGSTIQLSASGAETYSWSPSKGLNNPGIASPIASPGETTVYKVTGSDTKGCFSSTASVPVKVYAIPSVNAGTDQTMNVTKSLEIIPQISSDVTGITWTPSTGIIARNYPGITVKPVQTTEYTVEVINTGGCSARDRISVFVMCDNSNV
ncbi:MAG: PKD domain-containing protein, partial [Ginsengibacter sp.]